jgi:phosphatidylserine/phosphatidylglycerophosphate/cardiolipin synthase-like enzyme
VQRCKIIRNSKKYCFLFAFYFDWHYNKDIQAEVINALDRGVSIYINLSEVSENNICYIHPNLHVRQSQLYKEGDSPVFDAIVKLATNASNAPKTVVHTRFIYNGETLLLGGTNVNHRYNGNLNQRDRQSEEDDEFYWYDGGYLTHDYPDQFDFFRNIFLYNDTNKHIRNLSLNNTLLLSNETQHAFLCEQIRNAKHTIYIECQYFHTHSSYMSNHIGIELANRLNKAIQSNEKFKLSILTNSLNHDEQAICYNSSAISYSCLMWLRRIIDCDDYTFAKYVICEMPTMESKIIIHQKCWIFDEKVALYTTGNLSDRSFSDTGDVETGIIIRDSVSWLVETIHKQRKYISLINYDFQAPKMTIGYFFIDNVEYSETIYKLVYETSDPLLYETDFSTIVGMKF